MVWGAVAVDFKPPLFFIPKNTAMSQIYPPPINPPAHPNGSSLNQVKYAVWILQNNIAPMVKELRNRGRHPVVVEDNARDHDGEVPGRMRTQLGITRFSGELIAHVNEEWALIPMDEVNKACEGIARRVQEVRDAAGYATGH